MCEAASDANTTKINDHADCSRCGQAAKLDWENTQQILEHMGAHILYDPKLNRTEERCGLCLRPAAMCPIFVTKACSVQGRTTVDFTKSTCPNLVRFSYKSASESTETSPCSNVPITCLLCPVGSPAVWSYNLEAHFRGRHRLTSCTHFPIPTEQSKSEKDGMKCIWQACFKNCMSYYSKKKQHALPLAISDAHRSGLPISYVLSCCPLRYY